MTTYYMTPIATILQYFSDSGVVLNGGKVSTYLAGTSTPQATKTDSTGAVDNANPIILNAAGRLNNVSIWQAQGIKLKIIITDANNNQIGSPIDQVAGIDDPTDLLATLASNSVGSGADLIANAMRSFDLVSTVQAASAPTLVAGQTRVIDVQAAVTAGDGFGGLFYWSPTSSASDDGITVIKPTSVSGNGRYLRQKGQVFYAYKSASATPYSSTTLATDPVLQLSLPYIFAAYDIEAMIYFNGTTGGGQGIKIALLENGLISPPEPSMLMVGNVNAASYSNLITVNGSSVNIATITVASANDAILIKGSVFTEAAGGINPLVFMQFAQNSASANATNVLAGSYIKATLKI